MYDENQQPDMEDVEVEDGEEKQLDSLYIGAKIITACPMDECTFLQDFKGQDVTGQETRSGYKVTYPDNYVS